MSGYSRTPLPKKLGLKPESRLRMIGPSPSLPLGGWTQAEGEFDVALAFCRDADAISEGLRLLIPNLHRDGAIWLCWPKRSSGIATDCSDGTVRELGLAAGLVDNKVCAIDETWSGLRFVVRVSERGSWDGERTRR